MIRRKHVKLPRNALAASLASSDDQVVIVMIFSFGIQFSYMLAKAFMAATPSVVYKIKGPLQMKQIDSETNILRHLLWGNQ